MKQDGKAHMYLHVNRCMFLDINYVQNLVVTKKRDENTLLALRNLSAQYWAFYMYIYVVHKILLNLFLYVTLQCDWFIHAFFNLRNWSKPKGTFSISLWRFYQDYIFSHKEEKTRNVDVKSLWSLKNIAVFLIYVFFDPGKGRLLNNYFAVVIVSGRFLHVGYIVLCEMYSRLLLLHQAVSCHFPKGNSKV